MESTEPGPCGGEWAWKGEDGQGLICSAAWSADGTVVAQGLRDGRVALRDARSGKVLGLGEGHRGWVESVAWSPDGMAVASASADSAVRVWDAENGRCRAVLEGAGGPLAAVAWSPDGSAIASGSADRTAVIWDAATGEALRRLEGHQGPVTALEWAPDGRSLATGSSDQTVRLWDPLTGQCRHVLPTSGGPGMNEREGPVRALAWTPDGRVLSAGSETREIRFWDLAGGALELNTRPDPDTGVAWKVLYLPGDALWPLAWSPDGRWLASGGMVWLREHRPEAQVWTLIDGHPEAVGLRWLSYRRLAVALANGRVRHWIAPPLDKASSPWWKRAESNWAAPDSRDAIEETLMDMLGAIADVRTKTIKLETASPTSAASATPAQRAESRRLSRLYDSVDRTLATAAKLEDAAARSAFTAQARAVFEVGELAAAESRSEQLAINVTHAAYLEAEARRCRRAAQEHPNR
ncbi:MAG: WD40 repeat domain-containing protein [Bifidobacteriaceae bacterium]|jgi:WD40 repeat protein|nr:WD40 repeat domain-containing protein [Bifidobacteriaceae bacterium]